jgi:hypothetical protein
MCKFKGCQTLKLYFLQVAAEYFKLSAPQSCDFFELSKLWEEMASCYGNWESNMQILFAHYIYGRYIVQKLRTFYRVLDNNLQPNFSTRRTTFTPAYNLSVDYIPKRQTSPKHADMFGFAWVSDPITSAAGGI